MTMIVVTHKMGIRGEVAHRLEMFDETKILGESSPDGRRIDPQSKRTVDVFNGPRQSKNEAGPRWSRHRGI